MSANLTSNKHVRVVVYVVYVFLYGNTINGPCVHFENFIWESISHVSDTKKVYKQSKT